MESMVREHDILNEFGMSCLQLILCMLHMEMRITTCFVKWCYKTAQKLKLLNAVQRVLLESGINYNLEGAVDSLPNLDGDQCGKMLKKALPQVVDLLVSDLQVRNEYKATFDNWSSILHTLRKTHISELESEEIESLELRINDFVINWVALSGDKQMFSAVYFHMLSARHVTEIFQHHMQNNEMPLGLLSMSTSELRHKVHGRTAFRQGCAEANKNLKRDLEELGLDKCEDPEVLIPALKKQRSKYIARIMFCDPILLSYVLDSDTY
eukprot:94800-Hanusia_phi.AAC.1